MSHESPFSPNHRGARTPGLPAVEQHAVCPDCRTMVTRFYSGPFGISRQICGCGDVLMVPHRDIPIEIPEWMVGAHDTPTHRARSAGGDGTCAYCGQVVMAKGAVPAKYCGKPCRNKAWRQSNAEFLARGAERARLKRHARIAAGLTSRGTPRKRNYTSPKRKAA